MANYFTSVQQQEEEDFYVSSASEWDRADAYQLGEESPDQAWVNTDRDVWHANPFYQGPAVPHPEDDEAQEEYYVVGQHAVNLYEFYCFQHCDEVEQDDETDFPF